MKIIKSTLLLFVITVYLTACNKEGKGGSGTIEGKVMVQLINETTLDTLTTYEAQDEKVYIVYGEENTYGDDTRTTHNGNYSFEFLYTGDYTIYAYSECLLHLEDCPGKSEAIIESITISSSRESVTAPTIVINKYTK